MFKIGDWVRVNGKIQQIEEFVNEDSYGKHDMVELTDDYVHIDELVNWQPKGGEWCWVSDSKDFFDPKLRKFSRINSSEKVFKEPNGREVIYLYCEPFIGSLPTNIKE